MDDDAQLLRRYARDGAEEAFAELVRRHLGLVYGSALRRVNGSAALAEEVAQEVFAKVAREAERMAKTMESGMALAGWLYVATRHAAANTLRAEVRRVRREQEVFAMHEIETGGVGGMGGVVGSSGSDAEVWAQVRPELEAVMDELGEADRDAVLLRFFEGRAFGEIGTALHVSEDAARVRVNRALEKMRGLLAKRGIGSTAAALGGLLAGNAAMAAPAGLAASVTGAALISAGSVAAGAAAVVAGGSTASAGAGGVGWGSVGVGGVSAAGVSGLGAGILTFMTTTKLVTGVACVVAAVSLGTAVYQSRRAEGALENAVVLRDEGGRLRRLADEWERRAMSAESKPTAAPDENTKAVSSSTSEGTVSRDSNKGAPAAKSMAVSVSMEDLFGDPEYQRLMAKQFRASLGLTYGPLYRKLGLSARQIEAFEQALAEEQQTSLDAMGAAKANGLSVAEPGLAKVAAVSGDGFKAVLGEDGYREFASYRRTTPARETAGLLAANLYYTEAPLTLDQAEALTRIVSESTAKREISGLVATGGGEVDWSRVLTEASGVLSASQLRTLEALSVKAQTQDELNDVVQKIGQKK